MKSTSPDQTFNLGEMLARDLAAGDVVLLYGGLGAGKTLLTKGILSGLDFDVDEVTSPSFALVHLHKTDKFDVYHIDLWRVDDKNAADSVGLDEIIEDKNAVTIIEWAERLGDTNIENNIVKVFIDGEGDEPRTIRIEQVAAAHTSR